MYWVTFTVFSCSLFVGYVFGDASLGPEVEAKVVGVQKCKGVKDEELPLRLTDVRVSKKGKDQYGLYAYVVVTEEIAAPFDVSNMHVESNEHVENIPEYFSNELEQLQVIFQLEKCGKNTKIGPCEFFADFKPPEECKELNEGRGNLKKLFDMAQAQVSCPIPMNTYFINNSDLIMNSEAKRLHAVAYHWKITVKGETNGRLMACYETFCEVKPKGRSKKRS